MFGFFAGLAAGGVLAVGSLWFWLLLFVAAILLTVLVESEEGGWATFSLIVTVVILNWAYKLPIFKFVVENPWQAIGWIGVYFAAGVVWGLFKWYVFVHKRLALYKEVRQQFLKDENATELTPALALKLKNKLDSYDYRNRGVSAERPPAKEHKGDILRWMSYWPFSIIGTLLNDFVRKAWSHIYRLMADTYDRVSAHVFRKYSGDLELANQGALEEATRRNEEQAKRDAENESRRRPSYLSGN